METQLEQHSLLIQSTCSADTAPVETELIPGAIIFTTEPSAGGISCLQTYTFQLSCTHPPSFNPWATIYIYACASAGLLVDLRANQHYFLSRQQSWLSDIVTLFPLQRSPFILVPNYIAPLHHPNDQTRRPKSGDRWPFNPTQNGTSLHRVCPRKSTLALMHQHRISAISFLTSRMKLNIENGHRMIRQRFSRVYLIETPSPILHCAKGLQMNST